ncbi:MAG: hypothetical protein R2941_10100 [Desulfobacterales bacterium]
MDQRCGQGHCLGFRFFLFNANLVPQDARNIICILSGMNGPYALTLLNNHIGTFKLAVIPRKCQR